MTGPEVQRAVLQFPLDGERVWLSFDSPRRTIVADDLGEVPAAMEAAERAAADGSWNRNLFGLRHRLGARATAHVSAGKRLRTDQL